MSHPTYMHVDVRKFNRLHVTTLFSQIIMSPYLKPATHLTLDSFVLFNRCPTLISSLVVAEPNRREPSDRAFRINSQNKWYLLA
jgi:hypothetical protein